MKMNEMKSSRRKQEDTQPWYKQFWPWFLIALPGSVVIAAFMTLAIAIKHSDDIVEDDYYKDGLAINQKIERDQVARARNIQGTLHWQSSNGSIHIELPENVTDETLILHWMHPLKRQLDRVITLTRDASVDGDRAGSDYIGQIDEDVKGRFYLELENTTTDAAVAWRLRGEIPLDAAASQLGIALTP